MEASQKRERLVRFTGSDEVRVNDKRYMDQLLEKMRKESEGRMRKDEDKRADAERQRLRRLLAQGLITMDDMEEDSALYIEMKQKERDRGRKNNKRNATKKQRTQSACTSPNRKPAPTPRSLKPSYSPPPRSNTYVGNTRSDTPPGEVESQMSKMKEDEGEKEKEEREDENEGGDDRQQQNGEVEDEIQEEGQENTDDNQNQNADDDGTQGNKTKEKGAKFERYEDPRVRDMRDEETVDALYRIADELIIPTYKPKRKPVQEKAY